MEYGVQYLLFFSFGSQENFVRLNSILEGEGVLPALMVVVGTNQCTSSREIYSCENNDFRHIFDDHMGAFGCLFSFNNEIFELDVMVVVDGYI
ncbi:hypothetical protein MTR_7g017340 [Medicago truncatula]|nr:hypothetical protein MTR_7g017340 [Medicago truncatula]